MQTTNTLVMQIDFHLVVFPDWVLSGIRAFKGPPHGKRCGKKMPRSEMQVVDNSYYKIPPRQFIPTLHSEARAHATLFLIGILSLDFWD